VKPCCVCHSLPAVCCMSARRTAARPSCARCFRIRRRWASFSSRAAPTSPLPSTRYFLPLCLYLANTEPKDSFGICAAERVDCAARGCALRQTGDGDLPAGGRLRRQRQRQRECHFFPSVLMNCRLATYLPTYSIRLSFYLRAPVFAAERLDGAGVRLRARAHGGGAGADERGRRLQRADQRECWHPVFALWVH
jgi:hypothetical protein